MKNLLELYEKGELSKNEALEIVDVEIRELGKILERVEFEYVIQDGRLKAKMLDIYDPIDKGLQSKRDQLRKKYEEIKNRMPYLIERRKKVLEL